MKTLYLVRHAKSAWDNPLIQDEKRPLMDEGIARAGRIIAYLKAKQVLPDLMVSSQTIRTRETAKLFAAGLGYPVDKIKIERTIYDDFFDKILEMICSTTNEINSLMVFGHNPSMTQITNMFIHPGIDLMPTAGVSCMTFDTDDWAEMRFSDVTDSFIVVPRMLSS